MKKEKIFQHLKSHVKPLVIKELQFINQSIKLTFGVPFHKNLVLTGPLVRFSTPMWQNVCLNTVRHDIVCNVYFPFPKIL